MKRICIGFGPYKDRCTNIAGTPWTPWTPYWCLRCDELRRKHITEQLETMINQMNKAKTQ